MDIKITDPCTCGHRAGFHENEVSEQTIELTTTGYHNIIVTLLFRQCSHITHNPFPQANRKCECKKFELDNLKYLEYKAYGR